MGHILPKINNNGRDSLTKKIRREKPNNLADKITLFLV